MKKIIVLILLFVAVDLYAQLATNAPWPMFRQNVRHTGWTNKNVLGAQKNIVLKWWYYTPNSISSSPAIGADGTVYVGCGDGKIYALTNGAVKWSYATGGNIQSSPAIGADGTVYVGSFDRKLYALTNGVVKWSYTTGGVVHSSPAIGADGTVYVGSYDRKIYAITNGAVKWSYTTGDSIHSSPAIGSDNTVYVGSWDNKLYAITNGAVKWSYPTGNDINSSPAIGSDNTVYVGSWDNKLYAITNGAVKWSYTTGAAISLSSPAIGADGTVYIGGIDNKLYAITNGAVKWFFTTGDRVFSSPAIGSDNIVYVGSYDNKLYALTNGAVKWFFTTGDWVLSSPAIGPDGTVYVGSWDDKLYAIGQNHEPELFWSGNPGYTTGGVKPGIGKPGTHFRFEITYRDRDNDYPLTNMVWIDTNDNGTYENNERFSMSPYLGTVYSNSVIYTNSLSLLYRGDGVLNYRFYFKDKYGYRPLPCTPVTDNIIIIETNIPLLSWLGEGDYFSDGVSPRTNASGSQFEFRVRYMDHKNIAPLTNQVWIDLNDNSTYEENEKFTMNELDPSDTIYSNGKDYTLTIPIDFQGDGILNYRFFFTDNVFKAVGIPSQDHLLRVEYIHQTLDNVQIAPNPFKPGKNNLDYVTIYNLPQYFEMTVYSISGKEVAAIKDNSNHGQYKWYVKNNSGVDLKSGVYMCYFKDNSGNKKYIKLVVIK